MATFNGIPFNGGMDSPTGTGAQSIVETCRAVAAWLVDGTTPGTLADVTPQPSINWLNRKAYDSSGLLSLDWENRQLIDGTGNATIAWASFNLTAPGGSAITVNWDACNLGDPSNRVAMDWTARRLYQNNGTSIAIDFATNLIFNNIPNADPGITGAIYFDPITGNVMRSL